MYAEHLTILLILLVMFQLKHLLADFYMQQTTPEIWQNKGQPTGWFRWLLIHGLHHAAATFVGLLVVCVAALDLYVISGETIVAAATMPALEVPIHMAIDRWKAVRGRSDGPDTEVFWTRLGIDQCLHQLTYVAFTCWFMYTLVPSYADQLLKG